MSADNWTQCPRCLKRRAVEVENKTVAVDAAYGNVTVDQFDHLRSELANLKSDRVDETFREDWEIGLSDGEFFVRYRGSCGSCNLRYEFKYDDTVNTDGA